MTRRALQAAADLEVYSVKLDAELERRPTYQGTIFKAADVAKQEE